MCSEVIMGTQKIMLKNSPDDKGLGNFEISLKTLWRPANILN